MDKHRVLIVDDDEDILINLEIALSSDGYDTKTASSGGEAIKQAELWSPDVALLDIMMPDMDGYEVCRRFNEDPKLKQIGIIFVSARDKVNDKVAGLDLGAKDYITKPFEVDELLAKLRALLRAQQYRKQLESLVSFAQAINALDISELASAIREKITAVLPFSLFSVFICEEKSKELRLLTHNHMEKELTELTIKSNESPLMYEVISTSERLMVEDISSSHYATKNYREKYTDSFAICQPLTVGGILVGVLNLTGREYEPFTDSDLSVVTLVGEMIASSLSNAQNYSKQRELAVTDGLTKLVNHRHFHERLHSELTRSVRYNSPLSLLMIDIDYFKNINDTHGHMVGDQVLAGTAARLNGFVRIIDTVARYGGEEFAILLPETDLKGAMIVAERIREEVSQARFASSVGEFSITVSIGVCDSIVNGVVDAESLLRKSDAALYQAKDDGRDRVVSCNDEK